MHWHFGGNIYATSTRAGEVGREKLTMQLGSRLEDRLQDNFDLGSMNCLKLVNHVLKWLLGVNSYWTSSKQEKEGVFLSLMGVYIFNDRLSKYPFVEIKN